MAWGLALSGGGILGAAHLGVLRALGEWGLQPDTLAGTSAGGLTAGVLAAGAGLEALVDYGRVVSRTPLRYLRPRAVALLAELLPEDPLPPADSLFDSAPFIEGLLDLCPEGARTLRQWRLPTALTAVDLASGEAVAFVRRSDAGFVAPRGRWRAVAEADLATALQATMAMPGVYTPVRGRDTFLVDGGVADTLPVDWAAALGATRVLAVDVSPAAPGVPERAGILWSLTESAAYATSTLSALRRPRLARVLTLTPDTRGVSACAFSAFDHLVEAGYAEAVRRKEEVVAFVGPPPAAGSATAAYEGTVP